MKTRFIIVFILFNLVMTVTLLDQIPILDLSAVIPQIQSDTLTNKDFNDSKPEDEDYFSEDDVFLPKLRYKELPILSDKEKIVWSFRLARTTSFL